MMTRSANIGVGPITTTPWFPTPQPMSEGSVMQTFQDTVSDIMDSTASPNVGVQPSSEVQTTPRPQNNNVQSEQPKLQDNEVQVQEAPQSVKPEENPQAVQLQPQSAQQSEQSAKEVSEEAPVVLPDGTVLDKDAMKELADLMGETEDMLSSVEDMKLKLEQLILQAFRDLNDPEKQQEEYEEKILEFLLKYIEKVMGRDDKENSDRPLKSVQEEQEDIEVTDVLLQAVVQMLENIRSEDAGAGASEEDTEDIPEVGYVPPSRMVKEYVKDKFDEEYVQVIDELDPEERHQVVGAPRVHENEFPPRTHLTYPEPEHWLRHVDAIRAEDLMPEHKLPLTEEPPADEGNGMIAPRDNAYYQTAESIYAALTQPRQPAARPMEPIKAERPAEITETTEISSLGSVDELEELARLVRTGDSARPQQPEFTDHGENTPQPKLAADSSENIRHPEFAETVEKPQQLQPVVYGEVTEAEQTEMIPQSELAEQTEKAEQPKQIEQTAKAEQPKQTEQTAEAEQPKQTEQTAKAEQPKQIEQTAEAEQPRPARQLERAEQSKIPEQGEKTEAHETAYQADRTWQPKIAVQAKNTRQYEPTVKLTENDEAVPFEAAIATVKSEPVLTRSFGLEGTSAQQVVTQIVSEIFNQLPEKVGNTTFVMTLNPETLGKVTVKLVEEAGKFSVTVTAHSKHTAELLSGRLENLQTAMKENGTQLEKYQVVYAPEKDERSGQQNYEGSSKNPYYRQDEEESEGNGEFAELLQRVV